MKATAAQRVEELVGEGKLDEALGALYDALRHDKLDPALNERMHQLLLLKEDAPRTLRHGATYLKALTTAHQSSRALVALQRLQALDSGFEPPVDSLVPMARAAARGRDFPTAIKLLRGFDKRHPDHPDVPAALLLGARIAHEHLQQEERAIRILKALLQRFPEANVRETAVRYLASLTGLVQAKAPIIIAV